jgi:all-trans-retinol 13,14-reductase
MTAAALLSEVGERVLVLEQHYEAGGFTHTFRRPGYRWDVGVHAVGEVTGHSLTGRLLRRLTDGNLQWASLGPVYDTFHYPDGLRIDFPDTPHAFRDALEEAFPGESKAIGGYLDAVRDVAAGMKRYYLTRAAPTPLARPLDKVLNRRTRKWFRRTVSDVMEELTESERLRAALTAQWGYYGVQPDQASFAIQALVAKHFMWGAYYPVGGSQQIARTLLSHVADRGGWTRIATPVDEILVKDGRVTAVRCGDEVLRAGRVISGIGAQATVNRLLPYRVRNQEWARSFDDLRPAAAHVCLYLGFEGDIESAGATAANQWFYDTWDQTIDAWGVDPDAAEWPRAPVLYCSFPSLKDPTFGEEGHTGEVVTFVPWEVFGPWLGTRWKKRPVAYDEFKERMKQRLLEQFFEAMPGLRQHLAYAELSTPLSTAHFNGSVGGSIYGLAPTPARYSNPWLRPRTPVEGLLLAGCDVATPGVIGAMFGGVLAALSARPIAVGNVIREVM